MFLIGALEDTLLMSTGMAGQKGGCQTENSGGEQPAQTQTIQGQAGHKGDADAMGGEGTQRAGDQRADDGAAADAVRHPGHQQGDEDQHQRRGIDHVQHGGGHGHDAVKAQIGHHGAEHADGDDERLVGNLAAAQLGKVGGGGAGQGDGGGDAGQAHHHAEQDHANLAHQGLHDGHDQLGAADSAGVLGGYGGAQIGKAHVHGQQQDTGQYGGAADDAELLFAAVVALGGDALQHDDAKGQRGQGVHGLVAGLDAGDGHIGDLGQGGDLTQRGDDTLDDDGEQTQQQQRRQDLAHDIHHSGFLDAQSQDHREKQHGKQHRGHAGQVGGNGHLEGGGGGAGDGHHGADAQDNGAHQDLGGHLAHAEGHSLAAAHAQQGEHAQQRQTDVCDEVGGEARQPLRPGLHAQIGREHHVARAEKHGKQRKAHHDDIPDGVVFLLHSSFSLLCSKFC